MVVVFVCVTAAVSLGDAGGRRTRCVAGLVLVPPFRSLRWFGAGDWRVKMDG